MANQRQHQNLFFGTSLSVATVVLAIVFALTVVPSPPAQAQTYSILHNFSGGTDGYSPYDGLTLGAAGDLYGTTFSGGANFNGTVFRLRRAGAAWVFNPLYEVAGPYFPSAGVTIGSNGVVYGPASGDSMGSIFSVKPQVNACPSALCYWIGTTLYTFSEGGATGEEPNAKLVFDQAGNLYGTTEEGGVGCIMGCGVVFKLAPSSGSWTISVLYSFTGGEDGSNPDAELIFDTAGNLYGTTTNSLSGGCGTVFELTPTAGGWTHKTLYTFQDGSDGCTPATGLIFDGSGNLYGATSSGGSAGGGTVFELSPSNGGWTFNVLYSFVGVQQGGPHRSLIMDAGGNLYGTTYSDGAYGYGSVFELTPANGGWTYKSLHDFTGGTDGANPVSNVVFDTAGNLYGTAYSGGASGGGVVWEITP